MRKLTNTLLCIVVSMFTVNALAQNSDADLQYWRPYDKKGLNQFEALTGEQPEFDGVKLRVGASFAVQYQALSHSSDGFNTLNIDGVDSAIGLVPIAPNFNLPTANLDIDLELAPGVRTHLRTYLSSRHHPESWVKGGYVQIASLDFIKEGFLEKLMEFTAVKIGLMENNYGDYHFRRSDNARAIYNPFVGNLIMDGFTTEAGAEVYFTPGDFLIMVGMTNGNLNQNVIDEGRDETPVFLAKLGYDTKVNDDLRIRLTGSLYTTGEGATNYLYFADRAGSRYYSVMDPALFQSRSGRITSSNPTDQFTSGRINPSFINKVTAIMINPFVKFKGLEFFGTFENSTGMISGEAQERTWTQIHGELVYRFGKTENYYVGARYNAANGELPNFNPNADPTEVSVSRFALAAGWYFTDNMLVKAEYVSQNYDGYGENSVLNNGQFSGAVLEAVIGF